MADATEHEIARFWSKVQRGAHEACWEWTGSRSPKGYGLFRLRRATRRANRIAMMLSSGFDLDSELKVLHRCDNPPCCNPAHLFIGSDGDNATDKTLKGRAAKKLTAEAVGNIRSAYASGATTHLALARQYGVTHDAIQAVVTRKVWRHVP